MAVKHCEILFLILCACNTVTWSIYRQFTQQSELWTAFYSLSQLDCDGTAKYDQFPDLFGLVNDSSIRVAAPANLTTTYIFKRYSTDSRGRAKFYPGIVVEFEPPDYGRESVRGYEVIMDRIKPTGVLCFLIRLNLNEHPHAQEEKIRLELFILSSRALFKIYAVSLPLYNNQQKTAETRILTGKEGPLGRPAFWSPHNVTYEIIHQDDAIMLDIIFSSPPPQFGFRRFEISLLPVEEDSVQVQRIETDKCSYTFPNVAPGVYDLQIKPVDDFLSVQGKCLCHYTTYACVTCMSTLVRSFRVE